MTDTSETQILSVNEDNLINQLGHVNIGSYNQMTYTNKIDILDVNKNEPINESNRIGFKQISFNQSIPSNKIKINTDNSFYFDTIRGVQDVYHRSGYNLKTYKSKWLSYVEDSQTNTIDPRKGQYIKRHKLYDSTLTNHNVNQFNLGYGSLYCGTHSDKCKNNMPDLIENPILLIQSMNSHLGQSLDDMIDYVELEIGEQQIDRIHGCQLEILIHKYGLKTQLCGQTLFVPLPIDLMIGDHIYAIRNLEYHQTKINIKFKNNQHFLTQLRFDGYILSNPEIIYPHIGREFVFNQNHLFSYIFPDLPPVIPSWNPLNYFTPIQSLSKIHSEYLINLSAIFNHPTSDLYFNFTQTSQLDQHIFSKVDLFLNDRLHETYEHDNLLYDGNIYGNSKNNIYWINFGQLDPMGQNGGKINFSRIDTVKLKFYNLQVTPQMQLNLGQIHSQILRVFSGMAGVAYCA